MPGVDSFKKTIWEEALLLAMRGIQVTELITTKPSKIEGNKATFNSLGGGTVKDYTGTVSYDDVTTNPIDLTYDIVKYWAGKLADLDAIQSSPTLLKQWADEKALDIKEAIDTNVLAYCASQATTTNTIGTDASKKSITNATDAYDYIVDLGTKLSKKKMPISNRFVLASCDYVNLMAKDARFANNLNILPNGVVQGMVVNGMQVIQVEEVPANTVLCVHKSAIGYGQQLDKTEALRLEGSFADGIRGLTNFGRIALRKDGISKLLYTIA